MGMLAVRAFSTDALREAWLEVVQNDAEDGFVSPGVKRFQQDVDGDLTELSAALLSRSYQAGRLSPVQLTLGSKQRELHVPCVRDRIVARAILDAATPLVDPHLGAGAYAYRPGLGVVDAVQAVAALRNEGLGHVLRTDIKDCFPNLPKQLALERFRDLVPDDDINALMLMFGQRTYRAPTGGIRTLDGVPQGCPLSPLLANLVLVEIDQMLARGGFSRRPIWRRHLGGCASRG